MIHATELLGAGVYDDRGNYVGRVRELCIAPGEQTGRIGRLVIVRGRYQPLLARYDQVAAVAPGTVRLNTGELQLQTYVPDESWLTVSRDLLDQQIIDIHGRKIVRVNDIDLTERAVNGHMELRLVQVDVGLGGALRRLLKGVVTPSWTRALERRLPTRVIPWEFVDLIEPDPLRRVKLKLPGSKLAQLHPADIADILEELSPAEREAVIQTLDDATAAETLVEVEDGVQTHILEGLDTERAADLLERMPPDEAADALAELPQETADQMLQDMDREDASALVELLRFGENTAGGLMTPEVFVSEESTTVAKAIEALRGAQVSVDQLDAIYLINPDHILTGTVPLGRLLLAESKTKLGELRSDQLVFVDATAKAAFAYELIDKYNLRSLPVVDGDQKLLGVITVDDVVSQLWQAVG